MAHNIKTVEAVYEKGYLRPLEPIEQRPGQVYLVTIVDLKSMEQQAPSIKSLRGKYRGYLSSSDAFSQQKESEKALER